MPLSWLDPDAIGFPAVDTALTDPNGLLAVGGDLTPGWLVHAYQHGIFPWYEAGQPILWWSPDPRMVLFPAELHVSRSLRKLLRQQPFRLTMDQNFSGVINACGSVRGRSEGTWITSELKAAYQRLHGLGIAHSVEAWEGERLVGGLYGLALGQVFFGESMFSSSSNSSKVALVFLVEHLRKWGYGLIDCQVASAHLASLGAREIPRRRFTELLDRLIDGHSRPCYWPEPEPWQAESEPGNEL
ncbi:MAG: leucyl/phenylalanyl-tRNA--protein transferase [Gammaproteobacteria bacterium]|nr:leucyl/phenylalanyl-tRNA--protein transferase [Pseudomonadales bacterium]MCP5346190.1 leucyl/phenylalanyl-tRNA--protein transferase [Pseudomonadales bacterium]